MIGSGIKGVASSLIRNHISNKTKRLNIKNTYSTLTRKSPLNGTYVNYIPFKIKFLTSIPYARFSNSNKQDFQKDYTSTVIISEKTTAKSNNKAENIIWKQINFDFKKIENEDIGLIPIKIHADLVENKYYNESKIFTEKWIDEHYKIDTSKFKEKDFNRLGSYCYPYANKDDLNTICCFISWLFIHDDLRDSKNLSLEDIHSMSDILIDTVSTRNYVKSENSLTNDLSLGIHDILNQLENRYSKEETAFFKKEFIKYLSINKWEAFNRESNRDITLFEYERNRQFTSAVFPAFELGFLAIKDPVDDSERLKTSFHNKYISGCNSVCFINDAVSLKKEIKEGIPENLVIVLKRESPEKKWKTCIQETIKYYEQELLTFIRARSGKSHEEVINKWISGSIYWSFHSNRYKE